MRSWANTTERYRNELVTLYQSYPNADELVGTAFVDYLYKYYSECSSTNTEINDGRAAHIHNCNKYLVLNILPIFLVFLFYSFGKLQVDPNGTPIVVEVSKPVMVQYESGLESGQMSEVIEEIEPQTQQDQDYERETDGQDTTAAPASTTETNTP